MPTDRDQILAVVGRPKSNKHSTPGLVWWITQAHVTILIADPICLPAGRVYPQIVTCGKYGSVINDVRL